MDSYACDRSNNLCGVSNYVEETGVLTNLKSYIRTKVAYQKKTDFVSAFNAIVFKKEKITLNNQ